MFQINSSTSSLYSGRKSSGSSSASVPRGKGVLGKNTRQLTKTKQSQAYEGWGGAQGFESLSGIPTGAVNTQVGYNQITVDLSPMLTGIGPRNDAPLFALYKDIYYNDPVGGAAVDMISSLPFSDFTLGGMPDKKIADEYSEKMERLNTRTLLPELSVDYLVMGAHVSTLLYDTENKIFKDLLCYDLENCSFEEVPLYSQDPLITVNFSDMAKMLQRTDSPRIKKIRDMMGKKVVDSILTGSIELEPLSTLYIPRRSFASNQLGTSYFKRILPIYLIEKNLYRGTLMESARRQRGIMHITAGEPDVWDPTEADLDMINELFLNADSDPLGAIITTKLGLAIEEVRQGGDFWKVTDFQDSVTNAKYHALGISDGLLSGEASYNTADASLSVFIDQLRAFREMIVRKVFYNKLFPLISVLNGFVVNSKGKIIKKDLLSDFEGNSLEMVRKFQDGSSLLIPTINWAKQLKPEGDSAYLDMLTALSEKGVPVPLRVLAAAGGQNLDELLRQQADDLEIRKKIALYNAEIAKLAPKPAEGEGGDGDYSASSAARRQEYVDTQRKILGAVDPTGVMRSAVLAPTQKGPAMLNRDFSSVSEVVGQTRTGKKKYIHNQKGENARWNQVIARSAKRLAQNAR